MILHDNIGLINLALSCTRRNDLQDIFELRSYFYSDTANYILFHFSPQHSVPFESQYFCCVNKETLVLVGQILVHLPRE